MLKKIIFAMCILISHFAIAQTDKSNDFRLFENSFFSAVHYPPVLINKCVPIVCQLKVQVNKDKSITSISLSDSADSLFRKEFDQNKQALDISSLEKYLKKEFAGNINSIYLIPLSYRLYLMPCTTQSIDIANLKNYGKFNGEQMTGNVTLLYPIDFNIRIQQ